MIETMLRALLLADDLPRIEWLTVNQWDHVHAQRQAGFTPTLLAFPSYYR